MLIDWLKRLFGGSKLSGEMVFEPDLLMPLARKGKDQFGEKIANAIVTSGAEPGDIVEVDEKGIPRVVGRRPRIVGQEVEMSEYTIRDRLRKIYGEDVAFSLDVKNGSNVVVFRNQA